MKKTVLLAAFAACLATLNASAQAPTRPTDSIPVFTIADSASFTGKYRYENLPFEYMEVMVKDGKLAFSGGEYNGFLTPVKGQRDAFDAGGVALFTFLRNSEKKVSDLQIDYQGNTFTGSRQVK